VILLLVYRSKIPLFATKYATIVLFNKDIQNKKTKQNKNNFNKKMKVL